MYRGEREGVKGGGGEAGEKNGKRGIEERRKR